MRYYVLDKCFGSQLHLKIAPYSEQGFESYAEARRWKQKYGRHWTYGIVREDRLSSVMRRFREENN